MNLNYAQSICGARIVANAFGLTLKIPEKLESNSLIEVFYNNIKVGHLYFENNKVMLNCKYDENVLAFYYDMPEHFRINDIESGGALFKSWKDNIKFQLQKDGKDFISGAFLITASIDSEFGVYVLCHPLIRCDFGNARFNIKMQRNGSCFESRIESGEYRERIEIRPWDNLNGYFLHDIVKGTCEKNGKFPYRRYCGLFSAGTSEERLNLLHVYLSEDENGKKINYLNEFPARSSNKNDEFLQKCALMREIDPKMYQRIEDLRNALKIGNVSIFDRLVSICYDSYSDEMIKALFGVDRIKMEYQNGESNLINAYFGINSSNEFALLKKLIK